MFQSRVTKAESNEKAPPVLLLVLLSGVLLVGALLLLPSASSSPFSRGLVSVSGGGARGSHGEPGLDDARGVGYMGWSAERDGSESSRRFLQQAPAPAPRRAPTPAPAPAKSPRRSRARSTATSPAKSPAEANATSPAKSPAEANATSPAKSPAMSPAKSPAKSPAPSKAPSAASGSDVRPNTGGDSRSGRISLPVLLAVTIGSAAFLVVFAAVAVAAGRRVVARNRKLDGGPLWTRGINGTDNREQRAKATLESVPTATLEEVEAACEEYTNVIWSGPEFTVFKGTRAADEVQMAVMKLDIAPGSWTHVKETDFRAKVEDLARMRHDNLLNLLAYCSSERPFERILVFEYASNGTLYEHLHGSRMAADHLDWPTRMRIAMGTAYGLQYMHHELDPPTAHFKFDAGHVFLTEDYAAKVSDLGISVSGSHSERMSFGRRRSFNKLARAMGYSDWDRYSQTPSLDYNIRSFGLFLLEIITGRLSYTETQGPLIDWAKTYLSDPAAMPSLLDPSLQSHDKAELIAICEVIRLCLHPPPPPRTGRQLTTMKEVVDMLAKALRMTSDKCDRKRSPLLWAELQLLSSMDRTSEDGGSFMNIASPRQQHQRPQGSPSTGKATAGNHQPPPPLHRRQSSECSESEASTVAVNSPRQSTSSPSGAPNRSASPHFLHPQWAETSPKREDGVFIPTDARRGEEPEAPLAPSAAASSHSNSSSVEHFEISSAAAQDSFGRSFRRVWAENSGESDFCTPRRRSNKLDGSLGR